jgi:hypothetical protein
LAEHPQRVSWADRQRDRRSIFWLQIFYLVGLGVLAVLYLHGTIDVRHTIGKSFPTPVLWFGALGAVLISLTGVFQWCENWDTCYRYWHWSRPLIGASFGAVSVLIFQAGILGAGSSPTADEAGPKNLTYYLIAFLVGYREETFRQLIKRLGDVILTPGGGGKAAPPILSVINPTSGPQGTSVIILGTGLTGASEVKFGANTAEFTVDSDGQITATVPQSTVTGPVAVAVTTPAGSAAGPQFTYT